MRLLAITITLLLAVAAQAQAITLMVNGTTPSVRYQRILDASYVPLPDVTVDLILLDNTSVECGGAACASPSWNGGRHRIWMTIGWAVGSLPHEAGHIFDYEWMTDTDRDEVRVLMGESRPWRSSPNSPHERFASLVEGCILGPRHIAAGVGRIVKGRYYFGYELMLTPKKAAAGCAFVQRIAARHQS